MDASLRTERITVEQKEFLFVLKENPHGKFLRIIESTSGRRESIIVPAVGLSEFRDILNEMLPHAVSKTSHGRAPMARSGF